MCIFTCFWSALPWHFSKVFAILLASSSYIAARGKWMTCHKLLKGNEALKEPSAESFWLQSISLLCSEVPWWSFLWRQTYVCLLQRHPTPPMVKKCHFVATTFDNVDNRKALTNVLKPLLSEWHYWPGKNPHGKFAFHELLSSKMLQVYMLTK